MSCVQWAIMPLRLRSDGMGRMILRHVRNSSQTRDGGHSHASGGHVSAPDPSPIFQSTAFASASADELGRVALEVATPDFYTRHGNPNHVEMGDAVATLEGADTGLVFASGMGAPATTVLGLVSRGDHVVAQRSMYGGSLSLVQKLLSRFGVDHTLVDQSDAAAWEGAINPATRLFLIESPSNPRLEVTDLGAVADIARAHGIVTWLTTRSRPR